MTLSLKRYTRNADKTTSKVLVVLIHGLGAPDNTWVSAKTSWKDLLLSDDRFLDTDVAVIKYETAHVALGKFYPLFNLFFVLLKKLRLFKLSTGKGPFTSISKLAQELKRELNMSDFNIYEQILFVCHSMGGLVGIRYILEEVERDLPTKVSGYISLATPFNGSNKAVYHDPLKRLHNHGQIPQLEPNSSLTDDTIRLWQKHKDRMRLSCVFCFGTEDKWVSEESSIPHFVIDTWSGSIPLLGDHSSILDVENHASSSYAVVSENLLNIIKTRRLSNQDNINSNTIPDSEIYVAASPPLQHHREGENRIICLFDLAYWGLTLRDRLGWLFDQSSDFDKSEKEFRRLMHDLKNIVTFVLKAEKAETLKMLHSLSDYVLPYVLGEQERPKGWAPANDLAESIQNRLAVLEYILSGKELAVFKLGQCLGRWDNNEPLSNDKLSESSEKLILQLIEQLSQKKKVPEEILSILKEYRDSSSISTIHTPHQIYNKVRTMLMLNSIIDGSE
jgi:triacylglycerol esterase/lipase EstA (alpha/beta hydrolase family)